MLTTLLLVVASAPCETVELDAEIGADLRGVHGTITCLVASDGPLAAATYPRALRGQQGLDDVNREWFYPDGFDPADMALARDGVRLQAGHGAWEPLGSVATGDRVRVEFRTRVPRRNGTFGLSGPAAMLLGGWHPAFGRDERLEATALRYTVRVPPGVVGFVGRQPVTRETPRVVHGVHPGSFVPVVLSPAANVARWGTIRFVAPTPATHSSPPDRPAVDLRDVSAVLDDRAHRELRDTLVAGAEHATRFGLAATSEFFVVIAPLREHLVESFDLGLAVSDRAFHLLPWERFLKFHRLSIWRRQLAVLAMPHCRRVEEALPPELIADLIGSGLQERLALERYGGKEYAPDLLETFAVIPEIDSLIFAPQIAFRDAYYQAIDETPSVRWQLDDFFHHRPRGKLLYEKLADALGVGMTQEIVLAYLDGDEPFLSVASRVAGRDAGAIVAPWLGPYPELDYAIGGVQTTGETVVVEVAASGPDAGLVAEPITVEIEDAAGGVARATRVGPGEVRFAAPGPPDRVEIDPDGRLVELYHADGEAPRFNNREPKAWRFLLNNISSLIAVTNEQVTASVDFSLRRIHDLRWRTNFSALYGPPAIGGATTLSYGFGEEVTPLRLVQRVGLSAVYERLRTERGHGEPAHQGTLMAWYNYDDRLSPYWSFEGKGISARLAGTYSVPDEGEPGSHALLGLSGFYIVPVAFGHALLGRLRGDILLGDALEQNDLRLGAVYRGARGFERDEVFGRRRVIATVEYRHLLEGDGRTDIGGLLTWSRFEGGLFADAVYIPVDRPRCRKSFFYDVGYGVHFIADILNVAPAEISIDFGLPLNRCADEKDNRRPVTVYVSFVQSLAAY